MMRQAPTPDDRLAEGERRLEEEGSGTTTRTSAVTHLEDSHWKTQAARITPRSVCPRSSLLT